MCTLYFFKIKSNLGKVSAVEPDVKLVTVMGQSFLIGAIHLKQGTNLQNG